jgi:dehydrogenase/reductase SDR family protein 7
LFVKFLFIVVQQFGEDMKSNDKRMTSERCARLTFVAIVNKLEEAWIAFFPVLALIYFNQYFPTIGKRL